MSNASSLWSVRKCVARAHVPFGSYCPPAPQWARHPPRHICRPEMACPADRSDNGLMTSSSSSTEAGSKICERPVPSRTAVLAPAEERLELVGSRHCRTWTTVGGYCHVAIKYRQQFRRCSGLQSSWKARSQRGIYLKLKAQQKRSRFRSVSILQSGWPRSARHIPAGGQLFCQSGQVLLSKDIEVRHYGAEAPNFY